MPPKSGKAPPLRRQALYEQLLLFPERAEYLGQDRFDSYEVRLDHWRALSQEFRKSFEAVYERQSASVLLVHGAQGTGKTLFTRKLVDDFEEASTPSSSENLWSVLAGGATKDPELVARARDTTALRRVEPHSGWLSREREFARQDTHKMRVFLMDDVNKDVFLREWADLTQGEYLRLKADGKDAPVIDSVASRLVEDCRGDFMRSLFVLLSNDDGLLGRLSEALDASHRGLARRISLPLPEPPLKEAIVRTNTNRLNPRSYWYCLDQGGPNEKKDAYRVLVGDGGFIDSFQAVDRALASSKQRPGRPANKNLITLVTLGAEPAQVASFIEEHEMSVDVADPSGPHVATWLFRESWASALDAVDQDYVRRASLVESEFAMRWVALDMAATFALCELADESVAKELLRIIETAPSTGDHRSAKQAAATAVKVVNSGLAPIAGTDDARQFAERFRGAGQGRSRAYEQAIAQRAGRAFGTGLGIYGALRPDLIFDEYEACALTRAASDEDEAINKVLRRGCHVVEITSHLQSDLRGLDEYLLGKVRAYSEMLERV